MSAANSTPVIFDLRIEDTRFKQLIKEAIAESKKLKKSVEDTTEPSKSLGDKFKDLATKIGKSGVSAGGLLGTLGKIAGVASAVATAATGIASAFAFKAAIQDAIKTENVLNDVAFAMARTGEFSRGALGSISAFAESIEKTTNVSGDAVLGAFNLAKAFDLTNEQAELATKAAIELSAATGKDLNSAIQDVAASFNGKTKALEKLNPKIANLTEEEKKAGGAAKLLLDSLGGTAAAKLNTFGGALENTKIRFGDMLKEMGKLVTQNPVLLDIVKSVGSAFTELAEKISSNSGGYKKVLNEFAIGFLKQIPPILLAIDSLVKAFRFLTGDISIKGFFDTLATSIHYLTDEFLAFASAAIKAKRFLDPFPNNTPEQDKLKGKMDQLNGVDLETIKRLNPERYKQLKDEFRQTATDATQSDEGLKILKEIEALREQNRERVPGNVYAEGAEPQADSALQKLADALIKKTQELEKRNDAGNLTGTEPNPKNLRAPPVDPNESDVGSFMDENKFWQMFNLSGWVNAMDEAFGQIVENIGPKFVNGFLGNITGGAEGARKFLGQLGSAVGEFAGPFGAAVGPIVETLSQGPEHVKKQVEEFAKALPVLIDNIVKAIPVFIETLADNADEIIIALVKGAPRVTAALIKSIYNPQLYLEVGRELGKAAYEGLLYNFQKADGFFTKAGGQIRQAGTDFATSFKTEFPEAMKKAGEDFRVGIQQGITDLLQGIKGGMTGFMESVRTGSMDLKAGFMDGRMTLKQGSMDARADLKQGAMDARASLQQSALDMRERFVSVASDFGNSLSERFSSYFSEKFPEIMSAAWRETLGPLMDPIVDPIRNAGHEFYNSISNAIDVFGQGVTEAVQSIIPGGGGGGEWWNPATWSTGGMAKLSSGAQVRGMGNRDTIPSLLTPGELVIDRTTGPRLMKFIDQQLAAGTGRQSDGNELVVALLSRMVDLLSQPNHATARVEFEGRAFAQIMLEQNRRNARVA